MMLTPEFIRSDLMRILLFKALYEKERRDVCNASYHRNKHKRGIQNRAAKLPKEVADSRRRQRERDIYRAQRSAIGKTVKPSRIVPLTDDEKHQRMLNNSRLYKQRHLERRRKSAREWAERNRARSMRRNVERYHSDPAYNLAIKYRSRISTSLKRCKIKKHRQNTTLKMLGCSYLEFTLYIESQFKDGMSWSKVESGEIEIDHKLPVSSFNLSIESEAAQCFHFSNLQPLWKLDNRKKFNKILPEFSETFSEYRSKFCPITRAGTGQGAVLGDSLIIDSEAVSD